MFHGLRGWLVGLLVCALAAPWWNIPRDQADSAGMLAHLHALFVDADLLFDNEYAALGMSPLFAFVTPEGIVSNHWPAGASWLQAPGYALGIGAAKILATFGVGRGQPLGVVTVLAVRAWAVVVLAAMASAMARIIASAQADAGTTAARRAGQLTTALFVVGTPLLYYAIESPLRPHLWGAALCTAFVAVWRSPCKGSPWARTLALASLVGMASYVRPQMALLWLLVAEDAWSGPQRWKRVALGGAVFVPWPLLHVRTQLWMYGDGITDTVGEVTHHTFYFLFSTHHGVMTWCPVLIVVAVAVMRSAALKERGGWLILVIFAGQVWLDGGMRAIEPGSVLGTRTWAGGVSFGPRKLLDVLPLAIPAVGSLVAWARGRGLARALAIVATLLCVPTVLLHLSAWLDPDATTGGIMGTSEYWAALGRAATPDAWSRAWAQRSVPIAVPLVVSLCVTVPLLLATRLVAWGWRRWGCRDEEPLAGAPMLCVGLLLVMHGWLAVVLTRSDIAREEQPQRMLQAAARMTPAHVGTVRTIARHHAVLRARLGEGAAPAP